MKLIVVVISAFALSLGVSAGIAKSGGGANSGCGNYCPTEDNGHQGNGHAPQDGSVGNADDKNPPGQKPDGSDHNNGYECDGNHGVGNGNPAHTGCKPDKGKPDDSDDPDNPDTPDTPTTPTTPVEPPVVCQSCPPPPKPPTPPKPPKRVVCVTHHCPKPPPPVCKADCGPNPTPTPNPPARRASSLPRTGLSLWIVGGAGLLALGSGLFLRRRYV